jgi:drug/metabolite transporter (DMT)-like permease
MTAGVAWSLVAALGFGVTQAMNRKANLLAGAYRAAFGLLLAVDGVLIARMLITGEYRLLAEAPVSALASFVGSATIHYALGWTLLAFSQQQVGVSRTGAVVSATPLVGTLLAAVFLNEPITASTGIGVALAVIGVAIISMSRNVGDAQRWSIPWFGLGVSVCWGTSPMLIRTGLEGLDAPVLGLTIGLSGALVVYALLLRSMGLLRNSEVEDRSAYGWMVLGGFTGAVGIGAQWIAFGLTTIAIAITVQQLAVLVIMAIAPIMFDAKLERPTLALVMGTATLVSGSLLVIQAG